jgi:hypothetical protein
VSREDDEDERGTTPGPTVRAPACGSPAPHPWPERLQAEGIVSLGRACGALRLAAEYCRSTGRLCLRLLRAENPATGALEPRVLGCRLNLVLQAPGADRTSRSAGLGRSHQAALDQDFCFDGLSEE